MKPEMTAIAFAVSPSGLTILKSTTAPPMAPDADKSMLKKTLNTNTGAGGEFSIIAMSFLTGL